MRATVNHCSYCKAGPEFIAVTNEPATGAKIQFCGRCHKVQTNSEENITEPLDHLKEFAKSFSKMMLHASGTEVMAGVFLEGFKTGIESALSVPWSQKEHYWMEKYGVVAKDLLKEVEAQIASLNEMEKTASVLDKKEALEAKARELRLSINGENSVIR